MSNDAEIPDVLHKPAKLTMCNHIWLSAYKEKPDQTFLHFALIMCVWNFYIVDDQKIMFGKQKYSIILLFQFSISIEKPLKSSEIQIKINCYNSLIYSLKRLLSLLNQLFEHFIFRKQNK